MSTEKKLEILTDILGSSFRAREEYLFYCPFCKHHKRKFSINLEKGAKCWVCDWKTPNIRRVIRRFGTYRNLSNWDRITKGVDLSEFEKILLGTKEEKKQIISLPEEFVSLVESKPSLSSYLPRAYLKQRGITREDIFKWKIGYCEAGDYAGRIIIPSFNLEGKVNYFIARSYTKVWPKYKNPPVSRNIIFNELYINWDEDLTIVEGVFDAIVAGNAIPLLGSTLYETKALFEKIVSFDTPIYIALDNDAEEKSLVLIEKLLSYGVELYKVDTSDIEDVGEISKKEFNEKKKEAQFLNLDNFLMYQALRC